MTCTRIAFAKATQVAIIPHTWLCRGRCRKRPVVAAGLSPSVARKRKPTTISMDLWLNDHFQTHPLPTPPPQNTHPLKLCCHSISPLYVEGMYLFILLFPRLNGIACGHFCFHRVSACDSHGAPDDEYTDFTDFTDFTDSTLDDSDNNNPYLLARNGN